jgi:hypothetical protein
MMRAPSIMEGSLAILCPLAALGYHFLYRHSVTKRMVISLKHLQRGKLRRIQTESLIS